MGVLATAAGRTYGTAVRAVARGAAAPKGTEEGVSSRLRRCGGQPLGKESKGRRVCIGRNVSTGLTGSRPATDWDCPTLTAAL